MISGKSRETALWEGSIVILSGLFWSGIWKLLFGGGSTPRQTPNLKK
jgi:hypothetical protein